MLRIPATLLCVCVFALIGCGQSEPDLEADSNPKSETTPESASTKKTPKSEETPRSIPYHNPLAPEQIDEGWISLFDGHTLYGWQKSDDINWSVEDGAITADSGPIGLLRTKVPFADFELRLKYRAAANANSGIFIRCKEDSSSPKTDAYEINIADTHPAGFTTGSIVEFEKTDSTAKTTGDDQWHSMTVTASGPQITVTLDGSQVLDFKDEQTTRTAGFIGLQKNAGKIEFKEIILKPLNMTPLFNGKDLAGWRVVPGGTSKFTVEDGTIHVVDGAGFLETESTHGDFILQSQAKTHAAELNSGIFFRAMKGTKETPSHGYEAQIHNGFEGEDRNKPSNAGTGAIFRRTTARRVVSSDNEWLTMTLIACGPQISVWVDGYQVTDWKDERSPNENPRQGLRLEEGHISLQGHDPTTDLSFRKLQIVDLPKAD